jgi:hypothetical protein
MQITVIIEGIKNIRDTVQSLRSHADSSVRIFVDRSVRGELAREFTDIEFINKLKGDLFWVLPSGCLILTGAWDLRISKVAETTKGFIYCLYPNQRNPYFITNKKWNIGRWFGKKYIVPILGVTEV